MSADETFSEIREAVRRLCMRFPGEYWRKLDRERIYPTEFVRTLTEEGFLSVLIPEEFGGSGLGVRAATATPDPQLEPPGTRWVLSSQGLQGVPRC